MSSCYCGNSCPFEDCCEPVILGTKAAETAEQLMRSRYSGFVVQNEQWLLDSWHPRTRPSRVRFESEQRWIGLSIKNTREGLVDDSKGEVEFVVRFKVNGKAMRLHENSRFERTDGFWTYLDGDHIS